MCPLPCLHNIFVLTHRAGNGDTRVATSVSPLPFVLLYFYTYTQVGMQRLPRLFEHTEVETQRGGNLCVPTSVSAQHICFDTQRWKWGHKGGNLSVPKSVFVTLFLDIHANGDTEVAMPL